MIPDLQTRFDAMLRESKLAREAACRLNAEQLLHVPALDEWSVLQIVHHLVLADETTGLPVKDAVPNKLLGPLMFRLGVLALNRDMRLPLPSPALEPSNDVPLEALLTRWDAVYSQLGAFLDTLTPETARSKSFAHPSTGPLTPQQSLELGTAHTAYHRRQLERRANSQV